MIDLTEKAIGKAKEFIAGQAADYTGIRVAVVAGGCSGFEYRMKLESEQREGDQVIEVDGLKVFVDEQSLVYLNGTKIDFVETIQGAGFRFDNPNAKSSCGCGESFQV
ncbi:MAG: HesB/IscA family protein [Acidobacteriota bacterium]